LKQEWEGLDATALDAIDEIERDIPGAWDCLLATLSLMGGAITAEKVRHGPPDLMLRPKVGAFRALEFLQASAILRAAQPIKACPP
jgi:NTE family protein